MKVRQISVFVENRAGRLFDVAKILGDNGVNMRALSLADTVDFGVIRFIVANPEGAYKLLKDNNFSAGMNEVLAVQIPDNPGGLAHVLNVLTTNGINIEYMYAYVTKCGNGAVLIFRFEDTDKAEAVLSENGIKLLDEKSLGMI